MAKTTSKSKQGYYSNYKANSRWKTNRERKLKKLQKLQPNNSQITEALKNIAYRRKKPGTTGQWSKTNIQVAKLFKLFTGVASHDLFSSNEKVRNAAVYLRGNRQYKQIEGKVSFQLSARAHDKLGNLVWG
jgi:hypothetical protein